VQVSSFIWLLDFFHVLFGALWVGGAVFASFVAGPVLGMLSGDSVATAAPAFHARNARFNRITGGLAIVLGAIVWLGEGMTNAAIGWSAIVLALALLGWGEAVVGRRGKAVMAASPADRPAAIAAAIQASTVENAGFLVLVGLMVALRYGLP
jgi:hypothetical protein